MKARENPYRTERILKIRYRFQNIALPDVMARLEKLAFRAAIVGPEGSGKTTLLEDLQAPLAAMGKRLHWFRLTREFPRFSSLQVQRLRRGFNWDDILLFDGAEILGHLRFRLFQWQARQAGGLLVTTHRAGYLPTLLRTHTSAKLLGEIMGTLDSTPTPRELSSLFHRHRGNLREALREKYDAHKDLPSPCP